METIKMILLLIVSLIVGFGVWYLIFWFVSSEPNLFVWGWWIKILYLFFGFTSSGKFLEETT